MSSNLQDPVNVSVIIPLLNEAESLEELYQRLTHVLEALGQSYELVFVDDGSDDNSFEILKGLHAKDHHVRVIQFRRNYGKAAAIYAGFQQVRGEIILTMDADLQDLPEEIPRLVAKLQDGYDLVSGWKIKRRDPFSRKIASRLFNLTVSLLTGIRLHDFNSGFKCYRKEVTQEIKIHGELHRYIPVLAAWKGFKISEVEVQHRPRRYGRSRYGMNRAFRGFFDLLTVMALTRYSQKPLHLFGFLGLSMGSAGLFINGYLALRWLQGKWLGNRPLLLFGIMLLIVGLQFVFFGILAEMISYATTNGESYHVRKKLD